MHFILMIVVAVLVSFQSVMQKQYNIKVEKPNALAFSCVANSAALLFFCVSAGFKFEFNASVLPYSICFGLCCVAYCIGFFTAIGCGSLAITNLIISYSLIVPTIYGIVFLGDSIGAVGYAGIILLFISILLLNFNVEKVKFSFKWVLAIIIAFWGNGMCSTIQKMQQLKFDGAFKSEFMIIAYAIAAIILLVATLCRGGLGDIKPGLAFGTLSGVANGAVNYLVMILTGTIANAILFPTISAGGIVISFFIAVLLYKEKLTKPQRLGYIAGIAAVVLLNL